LGSRPRVVLERLGAHQASSVAYTVRADVRGRYPIGPLMVRLTDPFGLCELDRRFPGVGELTVLPRVTRLPAVRLAGEHAGTGESRARSVAVHGEDDSATREYRRGDDLRRVHWRSTARTGELMVRREEMPWELRATVLLDTRSAGHRGEGPASSFEWAVSATASIAEHLRQAGYKLRLVTGCGVEVDAAGDAAAVLDTLADVALQESDDLGRLVERARRNAAAGLVIGVFGALTEAQAELVGTVRGSGTTCVAFVIDSSTWAGRAARDAAATQRTGPAATRALVRGGWRAVPVGHGDTLAALWPQTARGLPGFARRAPMAETVGPTTGGRLR
ncbi:MAG TPA: DUF58 domain-containing protein, partial [Actinoplanes sp.]|nr:DUF58 domain-containing protein [Actinoplanes sp.]